MDCIIGIPLSEAELYDAIDEIADETVLEHLERCPYCHQQFIAIKTFEENLSHAAHPSRQTLLEYQFGFLRDDEQQRIRLHLNRCAICQATISEYEAELSSFILPTSAQPVIKRRKTNKPLIQMPPNADRLRGIRTAGVESLAVQSANTPGTSLFLSIEPLDTDRFDLQGQIVADEQTVWKDAVAALIHQEDITAMASVNPLGQFSISGLGSGTYRLRIRAITGQTLLFDQIVMESNEP